MERLVKFGRGLLKLKLVHGEIWSARQAKAIEAQEMNSYSKLDGKPTPSHLLLSFGCLKSYLKCPHLLPAYITVNFESSPTRQPIMCV